MGTIHTIRIARPDDDEMALFWKLYYAAQRVEDRWCRNTVGPIAEELVNTELSRQEKLFLLRAWQVLVDGIGGFGRLMSAYDTYVYNMQDPGNDCIAYKPSLQQLFADAELLPVMLEAYADAMTELEAKDRRIAELEAKPAQPVGYLVPGFNRDFEWGYAYLFPQSGGGADIPVYLAVPAASPVIHDQSEPDAIDVFVDQVCGDLTAGHQH
ncbi:hypothetical protein [Serratia plymuthica]|uniref:hypothetical protein n=1 Tax=Serratia plymuthica TaxID=82996 RepID=UPI001AAF96F0|nr:hypothetical protein [Serratia plymuthica]